jgi:excisionase family DNA binding protein
LRTFVGPERELPGEWATVAQIAAQLGLSRQRIDQLRREHRLPAVRTPHGWLYNRAEVSQWGHQHYRGRRTMTDVSQTPRSSYAAGEPPASPLAWAPGLNENQLALGERLILELPTDAPSGVLAQALSVAAAWRERAREVGFAGELEVPEPYQELFATLVEPERPASEPEATEPIPEQPAPEQPEPEPEPEEPEAKVPSSRRLRS